MHTQSSTTSTLVLIDAAVDQHQLLAQGISAAEVIVLDPSQDGIEQITQILSDRHQVMSLHLLAHGHPAELQLGSTGLNWSSLDRYRDCLKSWSAALGAGAEILLYGCRLAATEAGQRFVQRLSQITGAVVSASTTLVGNSHLGGNWELDFSTGLRRSTMPFTAEVLDTYPAVLATLVNETFRAADVTEKPWIFGTGTESANPFLTARTGTAPSANGLPGAAVALDTPGNGALRLTNDIPDQAAFVIYNRAIAASSGLSISFDFFAYNGTAFAGSNGDGISFFLINGTAAPTTAGAYGGSLGYAQKLVEGIPGLVGGYLGVGFDEFGNFSTSIEPNGVQRPTPAGVGTPVRDSVSVRGSQASQYAFLTGTGTLPGGIDTQEAETRTAALRRARIDLSPTALLTVQVDLNGDGDFADPSEQAITNYNVAAVNGALPSTFKFGFASSTGSATNIHEVRNLVINTFTEPPVAQNATVRVAGSGSTNLTGLSATDVDGTIASYTLSTLPTAAQGSLFIGNPSSGGTVATAGQLLTPAQIGQLFFRPSASFTGTSFTYTATDNQGAIDSTPATVTLTRTGTGNNRPPILPRPTIDGIDPGETPRLTGLAGRDPDGSIRSYIITSLPSAVQGSLYLGNPSQGGRLVTVGQTLRPAQINQLFFRAGAGFTGANFTYAATDNDGDQANSTITLAASNEGSANCRPGRKLKGSSGQNSINGTRGSDRLIGFAGNDRLQGRACDDLLEGGRGRDRLFGDNGRDTLKGGSGGDRANGGRGNDGLSGGLGRDFLNGAAGNDQVAGDRGNDTLKGGNGRDALDGGESRDRLLGGNGNDRLEGRLDNDNLTGEGGNDTLTGGLGRDRLNGGRKQDRLNGGQGNDVCQGGAGADTILGGNGNDRLLGATQADRILGGDGNDVLIGGGGADVISGDEGRDRFVYRSTQVGIDTITDFQVARRGAFDRMDLSRIFAKSGYSQSDRFKKYIRLVGSGNSTLVRVDFNGNAAGGFQSLVILSNTSIRGLSADSFIV